MPEFSRSFAGARAWQEKTKGPWVVKYTHE
jgi:hypothetical protein